MLISDWSSDVCSSDLGPAFCIRTSSGQDAPFQDQRGDRTLEHEARRGGVYQFEDDLGKVVAAIHWPAGCDSLADHRLPAAKAAQHVDGLLVYVDNPRPFEQGFRPVGIPNEIGQASCRERVCQYV